MKLIISSIIRNLCIGIVLGFLLHFLYSRRKLLHILRVTDFHHPIRGRRSQTAMNVGQISKPGSVSEGRNEEIMAHVAQRTTLLVVTILRNFSDATVNQSMSRLLSGRDSRNNSKKNPFNTHLAVESKAFLILKCSIAHPRI